MEFSKKIALQYTYFFFAIVVAGIVLRCFGFDISDIVKIVMVGESIVLGGYFGKAGFENVTKENNRVNTEGSEL